DIWNINIESGNPKKSKLENFQLLEDISRDAEVNLQRISYEKDKNNEDKIVYYVVLNKPGEYFEKIELKSGRFLNKNSDPNDFISSKQTNDDYQIGQLELFHSFDPIEIRPMIAAEKIKDVTGT